MIYAKDSTQLPWQERFNERLGRNLNRKDLYTDPETGMEIRLVRNASWGHAFVHPLLE